MTADELAAKSKALVDGGKHQPPSPAIERKGHVHEDVPLPSESPPDEEPGDLTVVDGAELLDELLATITRYVAFPDEHAAAAATLWIATTHALPAFECAPRLVITSPQKRCGKTRTLDVIARHLSPPLATVNATVAAIFRSIGDEHPPTLIIDEADTIFGTKKAAEQNEDLRALLNAGHQRGRPALGALGRYQIPTEFNTFAMAALAGIGAMPDTITDRAINITMRRRTSGEKVSQFRSRRDGPILEDLRDAACRVGGRRIDELSAAEPDMPVEDRAADTWEPLIAVADAAGGHWPTDRASGLQGAGRPGRPTPTRNSRWPSSCWPTSATFHDEDAWRSCRRRNWSPSCGASKNRPGTTSISMPANSLTGCGSSESSRAAPSGTPCADTHWRRSPTLSRGTPVRIRPTRPQPAMTRHNTRTDRKRWTHRSVHTKTSVHRKPQVKHHCGRVGRMRTHPRPKTVQPQPDSPHRPPGRCRECGYHVATQGHRDTCPANEGIHRNTRLPRLDADRSDAGPRGRPAARRAWIGVVAGELREHEPP